MGISLTTLNIVVNQWASAEITLKDKSPEEIQAIVDADIEKINDEMPKYKRIKQTYLRTEEFEKTTTQKIKRRKIK